MLQLRVPRSYPQCGSLWCWAQTCSLLPSCPSIPPTPAASCTHTHTQMGLLANRRTLWSPLQLARSPLVSPVANSSRCLLLRHTSPGPQTTSPTRQLVLLHLRQCPHPRSHTRACSRSCTMDSGPLVPGPTPVYDTWRSPPHTCISTETSPQRKRVTNGV